MRGRSRQEGHSQNGTNTAAPPSAATPRAINAFTLVVTKRPEDLSNIDVIFVP